MFLSGPPRRPDRGAALQQLRQHLTLLGIWLVAVRAAPLVLHVITKAAEPRELKL